MAVRDNIIIILCLLILGTTLYIMLYGCSYQTEHFQSIGSTAKASKVSDDDAEIELENSKKNSRYNKRFDEVSSDNNDINDNTNDTPDTIDDEDDEIEDFKQKKSKSKSKTIKQKFINKNKNKNKEHYKNSGSASASNVNSVTPTADLSTKEKKLLDAFTKGQLSDNEIEGLIESGAISEELVEKFLQHLEIENFSNPSPEKFGGINIEPFCGNNYASYY